jgi:hypothetical protein
VEHPAQGSAIIQSNLGPSVSAAARCHLRGIRHPEGCFACSGAARTSKGEPVKPSDFLHERPHRQIGLAVADVPNYHPHCRKSQPERKGETMFGKFVKKQMDKSPEEALNDGRKAINKGITGGLTKAFMGQEFVDKMNNAMDMGQAAIDMQKSNAWLAQAGMDATAEVVAIEDTGALINMNPVVKLTLKVTPAMGMPAFDTTGETAVSKIAIPRMGDLVKIKYNPANPAQFVVMS